MIGPATLVKNTPLLDRTFRLDRSISSACDERAVERSARKSADVFDANLDPTREKATMSSRWVSLFLFLLLCALARADGAADNLSDKVRRIPPAGVALPEADRSLLKAEVDKLSQEITGLRNDLKSRPDLLELLPDVEIYWQCHPKCAFIR